MRLEGIGVSRFSRWFWGLLVMMAGLAFPSISMAAPHEQAVFGGGCFWAFQSEFELLRGVVSAVPGYAGGHQVNPSYEAVCNGATGHAEVIRVTYDPKRISYRDLLTAFFGAHDPTSVNKQGNDEGEQYRSIILPANATQTRIARQMIQELTRSKAYAKAIVTEIKPLRAFYAADEHHQHYYAKHPDEPYCRYVVAAEIAQFKRRFGSLLAR